MPKTPRPVLHGLAFLIDQALPQTQCTRCGYPDCAHYAQAIATGSASINQCAPGGQEGIERLAAITGKPVEPLNRSFGIEGPLTVARIDEDWCIGCTLCIKACPTDAILGSNKLMHTVMDAHCTGCELCIPVCPVDCISLEVVSDHRTGWSAWSKEQADHARARYARHLDLQDHRNAQKLPPPAFQELREEASVSTAPNLESEAANPKKAAIAAALAKARALRSGNK